jgi:hypothetical protein
MAAIRGAFEIGIECAVAAVQPLPPELELWEPLIHDQYPPAPDEPIVVPILPDDEYAGRDDLAARALELFDHAFLEFWHVSFNDIFESVMGSAMQLLPLGGEPDEAQARQLIDDMIDLQDVDGLRRRLQRQAWLLDRIGDADERDIALALAAALPGLTQDERREHPFLRRLVENATAMLLDPLGTILRDEGAFDDELELAVSEDEDEDDEAADGRP